MIRDPAPGFLFLIAAVADRETDSGSVVGSGSVVTRLGSDSVAGFALVVGSGPVVGFVWWF